MVLDTVANYVRGLLMGGADIIPGVSGGTVALIVGIYERLIHSIKEGFAALVALLRGDLDAFREHFTAIEWLLILPLFAGIATSLLLGAAIIPGLLDRHPIEMRALFFGLILGSLFIPWRRMESKGPWEVALGVAAAVIAFLLVGLPAREVADPNLITVFLMASVAICAMILPGVSGAFLLLVFGIYEATLEAVHDRDLVYIAVFGAGAATGIGSFSGLLDWLLKRHHDVTMAVLVGLMAGSLRALWPWITTGRDLLLPAPGEDVTLPIILMVAGVVTVVAIFVIAGRSE